MTTSLSPRDLLDAYVHNARAASTAAGSPQPRGAFPGLPLDPTAMVYLRGTQLMYHPLNEAAVELTAEIITEALIEDESSIVVSDTLAFARLTMLGDTTASEDFGTLARRLRVVRGLPWSVKLPILTEALAYRFWLQDGLDETMFTDWVAAFGITAPTVSLKMRALVKLAHSGERPVTLGHPALAKKMGDVEQRIMVNVNWSGISTDCSTYQMLENAGSRATAMRLLDPALLDMHSIDGQVCKIVPITVTPTGFSSSVSVPFKLKEGAKARITDGVHKAIVKLDSLQYGASVLHAEFSAPSKRGDGLGILARATDELVPLYVMEEPMESFSKKLENKRWLGGEPAPKIRRDVPIDVLMAGSTFE